MVNSGIIIVITESPRQPRARRSFRVSRSIGAISVAGNCRSRAESLLETRRRSKNLKCWLSKEKRETLENDTRSAKDTRSTFIRRKQETTKEKETTSETRWLLLPRSISIETDRGCCSIRFELRSIATKRHHVSEKCSARVLLARITFPRRKKNSLTS